MADIIGDFAKKETNEKIIKLKNECEEILSLDNIMKVEEKGYPVTTYNLTVEDNHTLFVSDEGVLTHNMNNVLKGCNFDTEVSEKLSKGVSKADNFTTIRKVTAEETNSWWKNVMGYDNPPYKPGTMVEEIKLTKDTTFVRVYDGEVSGMYGGWVMKAEDIAGLTPKQIQDKFALPSLPKYMADVKLKEGTTIRTGIVNPLEGWGNGGGIQYDLMGQRVGEFLNPRELP